MKIRNTKELAATELRQAALAIAEAGLAAIETGTVIPQAVILRDDAIEVAGVSYPLGSLRRLLVAGVGKSAARAAEALERMLGDRLTDGVIISNEERRFSRLRWYHGDHPYPTPANVEAARALTALLDDATADDLVLCIVSGGGSAMLCLPDRKGDEDRERELFQFLSKRGATIQELNTVRKHLSRARGGFLAARAYPAQLVGLVMSDVPGDDLGFIASGPTVKDDTTIEDARNIIEQYRAREVWPTIDAALIETPKEDYLFERVMNALIVSNATALEAMAAEAGRLGFTAEVRTRRLTGEAREVGRAVLSELRKAGRGTALLYGGETTVTVTRPGKGGRNLELALSGLGDVRNGELLLALASDGLDNTELAGGICDIMTLEHAYERRIDVAQSLEENASYRFFMETGDALVTGPTGSNVADLIIALSARAL